MDAAMTDESSPGFTRAQKPNPIVFVHGAWHGAWCWEEHFVDYFAQHGYAIHAPTWWHMGDAALTQMPN